MILAKQDDGTQITFPNKKMFEEARTYKNLTLIQENMQDVESFKEIEVEEIIPIFNKDGDELYLGVDYAANLNKTDSKKDPVVIHPDELKEYTVSKFRKELNDFSNDDLEMFIKFDERATIINESKKELKRRS